MKQLMDFLRQIFVSLELLFALIPIAIYTYEPLWADMLIRPMRDGIGWGLSAAGISIAMLAFSYKEGFELLSLNGGRKVLIEWPDYPMLKARILVAFGWCLVGVATSLIATWMVAKNYYPFFAVTVLISGLCAAATATSTVALARIRLRELLGE